MTRWERLTALVAIGASGLIACDTTATSNAVVSDSAGIVIVRNTRPARDTVRLTTPAVRIGDDETQTESVFQEVHDVAFTSAGHIVVVDRGTRVVLFDSSGGAPRPLGAAGRGPGEYRAIRFALARGDTVALWDVGQRRMHFFRETGETLGSLPMPDNGEGLRILPTTDGWLDEGESGQHADTAPARGFILRRDPQGSIRDTIVGPYPVPESGWLVDPKTGYGALINPPALGLAPAWTTAGDRLIWASGTQPRIHVYRATGVLERVIHLPYTAAAPTDQQRNAFIATLGDRYGMKPEAIARTRAATVYTDTIPTITRVLVDDRGNIWAARFSATAPFSFVAPNWDVLDADGRITHHVDFPAGFILHQLKGSRALGIRTLDSGVSTVEIYRIQ